MKIAVLGAGSLGSALGAALAAGGSEVTLIARSPQQIAAIRSHGLTVLTKSGEHVVRLPAATDCTGLGPVDLLLVLVKSHDTRAALAGAKSLLGPETVVLSLQNGLGHEDEIAALVGRERLLAGKTYVGGELLAPGIVSATIPGKQTFIGELDGALSPRISQVAAEFERAGLTTIVSRNIATTIWDKLLVNVATGALSAITGLAYGELYALPELEQTAAAAVSEAMAVAKASGITVSFTDPLEPWRLAGQGLPASFKASMLQTLEKGQRTEIDFINGAVVREGTRLAVATPVNQALLACIKGIERSLETGRETRSP